MQDDEIIFLDIRQILHYFNINQDLQNLAILHKSKNEIINHNHFKADHFLIIILKNGNLNIRVNKTIYHLGKNEILILPPGKSIKMEDLPNGEYYTVLFTEKYINDSVYFQNHFKLYPFFNHEMTTSVKLKSSQLLFMISIIKLIKTKIGENSRKIEDFSVVELLFQTFIMQLMSYFNVDKQYSSISKNDIIYRFFNLVAQNFKTKRDVTFYSERLFINSKYLTRLLLKKTGKSAKEYIDEAVVMEAKLLLDNPKKTVKSVAEELNFSDQFHFSQYFKRINGNTPTEYRKVGNF